MSSQTESSAQSNRPLYEALLDYARSPGKSNLALREPAFLFASLRQILQIAAGRELDTEPMSDEERAAVRRAACFFTRTALLAPGADHYTLMGVDRNFDGPELKDHYRLLMRLIHPDFAGTLSFTWPADAAVRVNQAYEVLSSPVRRSEYERSLATPPQKPPPVQAERSHPARAARPARHGIPKSRFKQLVVISSVAGVCAVLISLLMGDQEPVRLVQRVRGPSAPTAAAKAEAQLTADASRHSAPAEVPPLPPTASVEPVQEAPPQLRAPAISDASAFMKRMFTQPSVERAAVAKTAVQEPAPALKALPSAAPALQTATTPDGAGINVAPALPNPAPTAVAYTEPAPTPAPPPRVTSPAPATNPVPPAVTVAAPAAVPAFRPIPVTSVTLGEAQPLLAKLLQELESGFGEQVIGLLERDARVKPEAQALSRQYDELVGGMRPVRLSRVEFKAEPADGRLLVTGHVQLQTRGQSLDSPLKKIAVRAEFASREGTVVMIGLSSVPAN